MTLAETVLDILAEVAETDAVRFDPQLELYAARVLDSLQTVELIVRLSDAFDLEISPAEFDRSEWATPARIIEDMTRRVASAGTGRSNR